MERPCRGLQVCSGVWVESVSAQVEHVRSFVASAGPV